METFSLLNIADFLNVKVYDKQVPLAIYDQLYWALDQRSIEGECLEFGVFEGRTINKMASYDPSTTFWGFDSFKGLPENLQFGRKKIIKGYFSLEGKPPKVKENVRLIVGWFKDTISKWKLDNPGQISFLHIDGDLYSSARTVLFELNNRIIPGTIIVFDELCDFRLVMKPGTTSHKRSTCKVFDNWKDCEWKALNEWVEECNRKVKPLSRTYTTASALIVEK